MCRGRTWLLLMSVSFFVFFPRDIYALDMRTSILNEDQNEIRIAIFQDLSEFDISVRGKYKVLDAVTGKVLAEEWNLRDTAVKILPQQIKGIQIGLKNYGADKITIVPESDAAIYINKRRFRGAMNIVRGPDQKLSVVNVIGLEEYIKGVLYHEVSHRWPMEALKAQAVAARSYALYRMQTSADKNFDVTNDIYSQVYGGKTSERYRTNLAVERTRHEVLIYQGKILPAYFHATCAGHTEDASELWKEDLPPLKGVSCPYCIHSPHYNWKHNFRSQDIQDKLNANGFNIGLIKEITIIERNKSGRIRQLLITDRDGKNTTISGKDFRNTIGPNFIRSNNYEIVMQGYYFDLIGLGWGHGVGLCQWGADEMARRHYSYVEILRFYYPGAKIADISYVDLDKNKMFLRK